MGEIRELRPMAPGLGPTEWTDGYRRVVEGEAAELRGYHRPGGGHHGDSCAARSPCGVHIVAGSIPRLFAEADRLKADLAATTARAAGYALLVGELRAALIEVTDDYNMGPSQHCRLCKRLIEGEDDEHKPDCILAAEPEARASELLARGEGA